MGVSVVLLALFAAATNARSLGFSAGFSSGMVLQRGPSKSAIYGYGGAGKVIVYIDGVDGSGVKTSYNVSTNANRFVPVHCTVQRTHFICKTSVCITQWHI